MEHERTPEVARPPVEARPLGLAERSVRARYRATLLARRPTAARRLLPDFLIIGAQKCGTTFLHMTLAEHPAISLAFKREVHYFDWNYYRDVDWYRAHFPTRRARDRALSRHGEFATGEKSPYYLFDPAVPARVRQVVPEVKLIVLLRDPVSRALSHFHQARRRGHERLGFEQALSREAGQGELPAGDHLRSYLARGRYAEQLERWLASFEREQVHITLSERLFGDPGPAIGRIHRFLGLTPMMIEPPRPMNGARYAPMSDSLREELRGFFADDVRRLTTLLGQDPGWW